MSVEVIVPLGGSCRHRAAAWEFCSGRYPWPVTVAHGASEGPWCKAELVNPAVEASDADVIVVADADCWVPRLLEAVAAVEAGWQVAVPHRSVHRLTPEATEAVLACADPEGQPTEERPYRGVLGGGVVVAKRDVLLATPLDPRFVGWGQEDTAWGIALALRHGPVWRPTDYSPLWHLHHPPQERLSRSTGSIAGRKLWKRYHAARHDPQAMERLMKEAHDARSDDLPAVRAA